MSMPSSSTSRVPRRSCQKRCSCTSLYLKMKSKKGVRASRGESQTRFIFEARSNHWRTYAYGTHRLDFSAGGGATGALVSLCRASGPLFIALCRISSTPASDCAAGA